MDFSNSEVGPARSGFWWSTSLISSWNHFTSIASHLQDAALGRPDMNLQIKPRSYRVSHGIGGKIFTRNHGVFTVTCLRLSGFLALPWNQSTSDSPQQKPRRLRLEVVFPVAAAASSAVIIPSSHHPILGKCEKSPKTVGYQLGWAKQKSLEMDVFFPMKPPKS